MALSTELIPIAIIAAKSVSKFPDSAADAAKRSLVENPAKMGIPTMESDAAVKKTPARRSLLPLP